MKRRNFLPSSIATAVAASLPSANALAEAMAYVRSFWKNFEPFTDDWYTNEVDDHSAQGVNKNYQGNFDRLVKVKNQYDPTNLFRLNANVNPTV